MKSEGFTLIELLGVIIILGVLVTIISVTVTSVLNDSETKLNEIQIEKLKDAAKNYYINEGITDTDFEQENFSHCVPVNYLIENGYIDGNEISNFETGEDMLGSIKINYDNKKYKYVYKEDSCKVCDLKNDVAPEGISPGDKYQCKVKDDMEKGFEDGYYFFVLSINEDGTTNLILERNIYYDSKNDVGVVEKITTKEVTWMGEQAYRAAGGTNWSEAIDRNMFGPVTAMNYVYKATKDWYNVSNIVINYKDEGNNYGTIITTKNITKITKKDGSPVTVLTDKQGYTNLKARMPYYREVNKQAKCTSHGGSCLLWAVNYTNNSSYYNSADGKIDVSELYGYWTLSTTTGSSNIARNVNYRGIISNLGVHYNASYGVRPVITLPKNRFENSNW